MSSFHEVGRVLDRITEQRLPSALTSLELSRQAERIVRAAPTLLTAATTAQWREAQSAIGAEVAQLDRLLTELRASTTGPQERFIASVEPPVARLEANLRGLDALVGRRLAVAELRQLRLRQLSNTTLAARRLVGPGILLMDARLAEWTRAVSVAGPSSVAALERLVGVANEIIELVYQQKIEVTVTTVNDLLIQTGTARDRNEIAVLVFPLERAFAELAARMADLPERLQPRAERVVAGYRGFIEGDDSLPQLRRIELALVYTAETLLEENARLSQALTAAVDELVAGANQDIRTAGRDARATQALSTTVLIAIVVLSLAGSGLIVWLYVDRNLVARLRGLSDSMLAIAGGNLRAPLPPAGNSDEIDHMARALAVFRDTAIEIEDKNLREVARARQQLIDAIESISEGFALFDPDDCLVLSNSRYRDHLHPGMADIIRPGTRFETILREAAGRGLILGPADHVEAWLCERLAHYREPGEPVLDRCADGRWIRISERRTEDGCTVAVHTDITELKQREEALIAEQRRTATANRQVMESIRYASRIQSAILPPREVLAQAVAEHFVIWEPRDIVGGDFYWCSRVEGGHILIVGDCTGHGVPGAFMTLIVTGLLNDIVRRASCADPAKMLARLHRRLRKLLHKDRTRERGASYADDGLEAGLCYVGDTGERLVFAGARLSLWHARDGTVTEVRGDRPMLGFQHYPVDLAFTNVPFNVRAGDCFYLATDGLIDQIGGERRRSFGKRRLAAFCQQYHVRPMNQQAVILRSLFGDHQGMEVQRDDVLVVGFAPLGLPPDSALSCKDA